MKIFSALAPLAFGRQDYVGYKVLRTSWEDAHTSIEVGAFLERLTSVDMWEPEHVEYVTYTQKADFMLSEEDSDAFMEKFGDQVNITPIIDDVGFVIDQQRNEQERATRGVRDGEDFPYDQYLTYPQLEQWILSTVDDELISAEVLGETHNGNNVYGIHIGDQDPTSDKKKIFMECNIHAREWITAGRNYSHVFNFVTLSSHLPIFHPHGSICCKWNRSDSEYLQHGRSYKPPRA